MNSSFIVTLAKPICWLLLCISLSSCIPVVQRFYQAPQVFGRTLDIANLEPIAGVRVAHRGYLEPELMTDARGGFVLPSVSKIKATVLMPAHGIKDYPVILTTPTSVTLVMARADILMRTEKPVPIGDVVIDTEPKKIARSPRPDQNEHAQLLAFLDANEASGSCDKSLGIMAVDSVNAARKLYWRLQQSPESKILQAFTQTTYRGAHLLWRYWEASCDWSRLSVVQRRDAIIDVRNLIVDLDSEVLER